MQESCFISVINFRYHTYSTCRGVSAVVNSSRGFLLPEFGTKLIQEFLLVFDRSVFDYRHGIFEINGVVHLRSECRQLDMFLYWKYIRAFIKRCGWYTTGGGCRKDFHLVIFGQVGKFEAN